MEEFLKHYKECKRLMEEADVIDFDRDGILMNNKQFTDVASQYDWKVKVQDSFWDESEKTFVVSAEAESGIIFKGVFWEKEVLEVFGCTPR